MRRDGCVEQQCGMGHDVGGDSGVGVGILGETSLVEQSGIRFRKLRGPGPDGRKGVQRGEYVGPIHRNLRGRLWIPCARCMVHFSHLSQEA